MSWKMPEPGCGAGWNPASRIVFGSAGGAGHFRLADIPRGRKNAPRPQEFRDSSRRLISYGTSCGPTNYMTDDTGSSPIAAPLSKGRFLVSHLASAWQRAG